MTREEAKQWIDLIKRKYIHGGDEEFDYKRKIALDMAIEALEQKPKAGHWIERDTYIDSYDDTVDVLECSLCGFKHHYTQGDTSLTDAMFFNYCPNCGAKMQEVANDDKV